MMTGGADHVPEVRAPSMRGQLRLWLRALLGGIWGDDPARVRVGESAVLGQASCASPVAVHAVGDPASAPLPTDPRGFPGVQYMLWNAYQMRRGCLLPGQDTSPSTMAARKTFRRPITWPRGRSSSPRLAK